MSTSWFIQRLSLFFSMKKYLSIIFFVLAALTVNAQSKAIDEGRFVSIGGIEQWITIKTEDSSKPIILFLHGGPGSTMSPYDAVYSEWKKDFILVNWDQRGAGRTFGRNAPAGVDEEYWLANPLTVEQMTADGIELSEYLIKYLGKQKIILVGTSWGSVLGAKMALARPELYQAYVGHSQIVNASTGLIHAYNKVVAMAERAQDQEALSKLKSLGPPPYDDAKNDGQLLRIIKRYEKENSVPAPAEWWKLANEYDNEMDSKDRYNGDDYSFINYAGHKKLGIKSMASGVDFMKDGLHFKIPVYLIQGEADILTARELTKEYFDKLQAPKKEFLLLPGAAHGHNQSVIDAQYKLAKKSLL